MKEKQKKWKSKCVRKVKERKNSKVWKIKQQVKKNKWNEKLKNDILVLFLHRILKKITLEVLKIRLKSVGINMYFPSKIFVQVLLEFKRKTKLLLLPADIIEHLPCNLGRNIMYDKGMVL